MPAARAKPQPALATLKYVEEQRFFAPMAVVATLKTPPSRVVAVVLKVLRLFGGLRIILVHFSGMVEEETILKLRAVARFPRLAAQVAELVSADTPEKRRSVSSLCPVFLSRGGLIS